jgi:hypothetical protein
LRIGGQTQVVVKNGVRPIAKLSKGLINYAGISAFMLMCGHGGPGRARIASGGDDNHFAGCASLTDMSKCGGNLVEREGAVDVDLDVPCNAEGG